MCPLPCPYPGRGHLWLQLLFLHLEGGSLLCKDAAKMEDFEQGLWRPWDAQGAPGELSFPRRLGPGERSLDKWKTAEQDGLLSKMAGAGWRHPAPGQPPGPCP